MNTTLKIAKAELKTLFYSPIAWFLLIVFLLQCGLGYTDKIDDFLTQQSVEEAFSKNENSLTHLIIGKFGLFGDILTQGYLYLPLLTMGLISRETSTGTIKLLYSSPLKVQQIVFGKYIAMAVYNLLLIVTVAIFVVSATIHIHSVETGKMLSGLLSLYLLFSTYAAIGLFMSCLTSYQVVAAISTLAVFAILNYIGSLWQSIEFVRDLTYFLSIGERTTLMMLGLITSKDVLYFIIVIGMFLGFSIVKLQTGRESKSTLIIAVRYIAVAAVSLLTGYITSLAQFNAYFDVTDTKAMTLTSNSQELIKKMNEGPLEITSYVNLLDQNYFFGDPGSHNDFLDRWDKFRRFKQDIVFKYVYYYDSASEDQQLFERNPGKSLSQIAQQRAKTYHLDLKNFKTPAEIKQVIDLSAEDNRYVMQLKYRNRTTFLRLYNDNSRFPSETEVDAALKRVTATIPRIAFLSGESERTKDNLQDKNYELIAGEITFRNSLVNQGFDAETISLQTNDIPKNIDALVIADPKKGFTPEVFSKLQNYIQGGGNLLIAAEPGRQSLLNPLIQPMGIQLMNGMLMQKSIQFSPDIVLPHLTKQSGSLSKGLAKSFDDSICVSMPGAVGLSYTHADSYHVTPLLMTDTHSSWNRNGALLTDSAEASYFSAAGDVSGSFPAALAITRLVNGKEQRIIVTGDADFLSNAELKRGGTANFDFSISLFSWFTYKQFPVDTSRPKKKDNTLTLTDTELSKLKILYLGILPGILLLTGAFFLVMRQRK